MNAKRRGREKEQPVVSVLIPVFNAEKFLVPALDSVLGQSLHKIEIICADDGSTDGSAAILAAYAAKDSRLRIVTTAENGGLPAARNLAFSEARGRYTYFFDADDDYNALINSFDTIKVGSETLDASQIAEKYPKYAALEGAARLDAQDGLIFVRDKMISQRRGMLKMTAKLGATALLGTASAVSIRRAFRRLITPP